MKIGNYSGLHIDAFISPKSEKAFLNGKPTSKVESAMSDEYIEKIREYARQDAAQGKYMNEGKSGYVTMRNQMCTKYVSPDRQKAISFVSKRMNNVFDSMKNGKNLIAELMGLNNYKAHYQKSLLNSSVDIFDNNGAMIASYNNGINGTGWVSVPTKDETQFGYKSNQIYMQAYQEARKEIEAGSLNAKIFKSASGTENSLNMKI